MGRPSSYTAEIAASICARLADGQALRTICEGEDMPDRATVYRWLGAYEVFRDLYARAREEQADTLADEIIAIADMAEDAQKGRLQVDARKWVAAKLKPKKYGERLDHTVAGPDGGPVQAKVTVEFVGANPGGVPIPLGNQG